jgi:hypothetical protein
MYALVVLLVAAQSLEAQRRETARLGISVGGVSTLGVIIEYLHGQSSLELNVGTWSFRDLSVSVVRRHYLGVARVRPTVGLGLWGVVAFPSDGRPSAALVVRAPIGVEWSTWDAHALTLDVNVNQGIWIRRSDPEDDTPMNRRLIPLPGAAWRWRSR